MTAKCLVAIPGGDYETHHELEWLADLGTHAMTGKTRKQLVEGYLKGCEKLLWGTLSKSIITRKAKAMLAAMGGT